MSSSSLISSTFEASEISDMECIPRHVYWGNDDLDEEAIHVIQPTTCTATRQAEQQNSCKDMLDPLALSNYHSSSSFSFRDMIFLSYFTKMFERMDYCCRNRKISRRKVTFGRVLSLFLKLIIVFLLIGLSIHVTTMYLYHERQRKQMFERQFKTYANQLGNSFTANVQRHVQVLHSFSLSMTTSAQETKTLFPLFYLMNWKEQAATICAQTDCGYLAWIPLVTDSTRKEYENYVMENKDQWLDGSENTVNYNSSVNNEHQILRDELLFEHLFQQDQNNKNNNSHHGSDHSEKEEKTKYMLIHHDPEHNNFIWGLDNQPQAKDTGPYLPVWQSFPLTSTTKETINFDIREHPIVGSAAVKSLLSRKAFMSQTQYSSNSLFSFSDGVDLIDNDQIMYNNSDVAVEDDSNMLSYLLYPVTSFTSDAETSQKIRGLILSTFDWRLNFVNILPSDIISEVIVVIKSKLWNQIFSFRIDGINNSEIVFIGQGDHHDRKYDFTGVHITSIDHEPFHAFKSDKTWHVDLNFSYTLHIYPSQATEDAFASNPHSLALLLPILLILSMLVLLDLLISSLHWSIVGGIRSLPSHSVVVGVIRDEDTRQKSLKDCNRKKIGNKSKFQETEDKGRSPISTDKYTKPKLNVSVCCTPEEKNKTSYKKPVLDSSSLIDMTMNATETSISYDDTEECLLGISLSPVNRILTTSAAESLSNDETKQRLTTDSPRNDDIEGVFLSNLEDADSTMWILNEALSN